MQKKITLRTLIYLVVIESLVACFNIEKPRDPKFSPTVAVPVMTGRVKMTEFIDSDTMLVYENDKLYLNYLLENVLKDSVAKLFPIDINIPEIKQSVPISTLYGFAPLPERVTSLKIGSSHINITTPNIQFNIPTATEQPQFKRLTYRTGLLKIGYELNKGIMRSCRLAVEIRNLFENENNYRAAVPIYYRVEFDLARTSQKGEISEVLDDYIIDLSKKQALDVYIKVYSNTGAEAYSTEQLTVSFETLDSKFKNITGDMGVMTSPTYTTEISLPDMPLDNETFKLDADIKLAKHNEYISLKSTFGVPMQVKLDMEVDNKKIQQNSPSIFIRKPEIVGDQIRDTLRITDENSDIEKNYTLSSKIMKTTVSTTIGNLELDTTEYLEYDNSISANFGIYMPIELDIKKMSTHSIVDFDFEDFNLDDLNEGKFLFDITNEFEVDAYFSIRFCNQDTMRVFTALPEDGAGNRLTESVKAAVYSSEGVLLPQTQRAYYPFKKEHIDKIKTVKFLLIDFTLSTQEGNPLKLDTTRAINYTINTIVKLDK